MKITCSSELLMLCFCLLLSSCTSNQNRTERQMRSVDANIEEIRSLQAEHVTRLSSLESAMRSLSGRLEEIEFVLRRESGEPDKEVNTLRQQIEDLRRRVPAPALVPSDALESDEVFASRLQDAGNEEDATAFSNMLVRVREGNYREVIPMISRMQKTVISPELPPLLIFWKGIALEGVGEFADAVRAFNELSRSFPEHSRAPLALLRQGSVFIRLGDTEAAELSFRKILQAYPSTTEARVAQERLADLS